MIFRRAKENERNLFSDAELLFKRTALVAEKDGVIHATFEYNIESFEEASIQSFNMLIDSNEKSIMTGFIGQVQYWNPYLKKMTKHPELHKTTYELVDLEKYSIEEEGIIIDQNISVSSIMLSDVIPEQLTVDCEKYKVADSWIKKPEDIVITCIDFDGKKVCIDGYSRLMVAYNRGYDSVYMHLDEEYNKDFIENCLKWCREGEVNTIADLADRIVSPEEHKTIWIDKCQAYFSD